MSFLDHQHHRAFSVSTVCAKHFAIPQSSVTFRDFQFLLRRQVAIERSDQRADRDSEACLLDRDGSGTGYTVFAF